MEKNYYSHESSIIESSSKIGAGTKIWHFCHIMDNSEIGENCNIGQNVVISPDVKIGKNVKIQNNVSLYTGVICEDDVFLGPSCVFTNVTNPRSFISRKSEFKTTLVKQGASIGANATIVCGNTIGKYALIGAGAVVCSDIPDFALVVGNPSRQIAWVSKAGIKLSFGNDNIAICPETGEKYLLRDNKVILLAD
jgi:UDP-2-acetamido-3-amino-2,3-dideoxy-glucuronate N-acetyltransferase